MARLSETAETISSAMNATLDDNLDRSSSTTCSSSIHDMDLNSSFISSDGIISGDESVSKHYFTYDIIVISYDE